MTRILVYNTTKDEWSWGHNIPEGRRRGGAGAAILEGKLYLAGGRKTSASTKEVFNLTTPEVDVFDLPSMKWTTLPSPHGNLPTPRAGTFSFVVGKDLLIAGGESGSQKTAHHEVESLDTRTGTWQMASQLAQGRHGTGIVRWNHRLYTASGCGNRGGSPELDTTEVFQLKRKPEAPQAP